MKSFELTQKIFVWFGIRLKNDDASIREKIFDTVRFGVIFSNISFITISSIVYLFRHLGDFDACLFASFQVIGLVTILASLVQAYLRRRQLSEIFAMFQQMYDEHDDDKTFPILIQVNSRNEKLFEFSIKLSVIGYNSFTMSLGIFQLIFIIHKYFIDNYMNKDYFIIPFKLVSPWDRTTLIGWMFTFIFCSCEASLIVLTFNIILFFFVGISLHHSAFCKQFALFTIQLNQLIVVNGKNTIQKRIEIKNWLVKMIRFHNSTKSIFKKTANFYSVIIFFELISGIVRLSMAVFQIETAIRNPKLDLFSIIIIFSFAIASLFIYCYFGKKATDSYLMFGDYLYEMEWLKLSIDRQKDLVLIISNTQRPMHYHGLKIVDMNLSTFTQIMKIMLNIYLMFKSMANN